MPQGTVARQPQPPRAPAPPLLVRSRVLDAVIVLTYLLMSFGLYRELWLHLGSGSPRR